MVHILMTKGQHCNKRWKKRKKEQTGKRKENNNTRKKYVYTKRANPKFNRIVKLTKTKHAKGQQKDKRTNTFVK